MSTSNNSNKTNNKTSKKVKKESKVRSKPAVTKGSAPAKNIPSLDTILDEADRAFTDIVRKYLILGEALVKAITFYGPAGKKAFRARFPLTDNALRNLELVGRGHLLPQFSMCSDRFVKGLVNIADSLTWQYKLLGASKNGMIRIRINGNVVDAKLEDLKSSKTVDGVLSIISDENKDLTPNQICEKLMNLTREVRSKFEKKNRPLFQITSVAGKKVVKFFKAKPLTAEDLKKVLLKLTEEL